MIQYESFFFQFCWLLLSMSSRLFKYWQNVKVFAFNFVIYCSVWAANCLRTDKMWKFLLSILLFFAQYEQPRGLGIGFELDSGRHCDINWSQWLFFGNNTRLSLIQWGILFFISDYTQSETVSSNYHLTC